MGEVIQFVPKAERERIRLIQKARLSYDSVFPPFDSLNKRSDNTPTVLSVNGTWIHQGGEVLT